MGLERGVVEIEAGEGASLLQLNWIGLLKMAKIHTFVSQQQCCYICGFTDKSGYFKNDAVGENVLFACFRAISK